MMLMIQNFIIVIAHYPKMISYKNGVIVYSEVTSSFSTNISFLETPVVPILGVILIEIIQSCHCLDHSHCNNSVCPLLPTKSIMSSVSPRMPICFSEDRKMLADHQTEAIWHVTVQLLRFLFPPLQSGALFTMPL